MVSTTWSLLIACVISISMKVDMVSASQEIVKKMSAGFGKALESCKTELSVGDHIIQDFYNFWREDYQLLNRDFGCILVCMAAKNDLIDENMKMHHGNAHAFAKTHGADDDTAKQLVTMLHECENQYNNIEDFCDRVLKMAKCFRTKIHQLKWAPPMEVLIEEVMTSM